MVVHIAKQEYLEYNILTYILQPNLDNTMLYSRHFPQSSYNLPNFLTALAGFVYSYSSN